MTVRSQVVRAAARFANPLQQARGNTSARWLWRSDGDTLRLVERLPRRAHMLSLPGLVDCGEVLNLVSTALLAHGWGVRITLPDEACESFAALRVLRPQQQLNQDDLYIATRSDENGTDADFSDVPDRAGALILLRDAAAEHSVDLAVWEARDPELFRIPAVREAQLFRQVAAEVSAPVDSTALGLLSTSGVGAAALLRMGMAAAEVRLTAAELDMRAVRISNRTSMVLNPRESAEQARVAFRFDRPLRAASPGHHHRTDDGPSRQLSSIPVPATPVTSRNGRWMRTPRTDSRTGSPGRDTAQPFSFSAAAAGPEY